MVYAIKFAKNIAALIAVSQNMMNSDLSITDGRYGVLSGNDIKNSIFALERTEGISFHIDKNHMEKNEKIGFTEGNSKFT